MGSFYRSAHELVFLFKNGTGSQRNNIQLGKFGRNRTNVWSYPGANSFSRSDGEGNLLALHPTPKPVALIADAIKYCTARGEGKKLAVCARPPSPFLCKIFISGDLGLDCKFFVFNILLQNIEKKGVIFT